MNKLNLHNLFLEQIKEYNPTKDDLSRFNYPTNVGTMGATTSSEWYEKMSSMILNELEVLKSQKMGKGIEYCKPCELSVTGTIKGDIESEKICVNKGLYYKKWDCPEGYGTYSVLSKEYGTTDWRVLYEMTKKLPTTKYIDPLTWFKDPQNLLTFLEITTAFIPVVGPFLSAGFGLGNAAIYYNQGNKKDAALSAFFALLPGLGSVGTKIVSKIGSKELGILSEKLIKNGLNETEGITKEFLEKNINKFTKKEVETLETIVKNKESLRSEIKNIPFKDPKKLTNYISSLKNKGIATATDVGINVGGVVAGLAAYPIFKKLNPGVREKLEKMGYNFDEIKSSFMSSGTTEDNMLMVSALNSGWTPDKDVPEKFQTKLYKQSVENMGKISSKELELSELESEDWQNTISNWEKELGI